MNQIPPPGRGRNLLLLPIILACLMCVIPALIWKPGMQINSELLLKGALFFILFSGGAGFIYSITHGGDVF